MCQEASGYQEPVKAHDQKRKIGGYIYPNGWVCMNVHPWTKVLGMRQEVKDSRTETSLADVIVRKKERCVVCAV